MMIKLSISGSAKNILALVVAQTALRLALIYIKIVILGVIAFSNMNHVFKSIYTLFFQMAKRTLIKQLLPLLVRRKISF